MSATIHWLPSLPAVASKFCTLIIEGGIIYGAASYRPGARILVINNDEIASRTRPLAPVIDLAKYRRKKQRAAKRAAKRATKAP